MQDLKYKFLKLAGLMSDRSPSKNMDPNGGLDYAELKKRENDRQLQMIDAKIAQLEQSEDPNSLQSLNFWKSKRSELTSQD